MVLTSKPAAVGINSSPRESTPVLEALWAHPLVGGISAGAMMQPSAAHYTGAEIGYSRPGTRSSENSENQIEIGEALMNNRGVSDGIAVCHVVSRGQSVSVLTCCGNWLGIGGFCFGQIYHPLALFRAGLPGGGSYSAALQMRGIRDRFQ